MPGTQFHWFRSRMLGGRTNHWGRISLRFGPDDFRRRSIDGLGDDWPIGLDCKRDRDHGHGPTLGQVLRALDAGESLVEIEDEESTVRVWVD